MIYTHTIDLFCLHSSGGNVTFIIIIIIHIITTILKFDAYHSSVHLERRKETRKTTSLEINRSGGDYEVRSDDWKDGGVEGMRGCEGEGRGGCGRLRFIMVEGEGMMGEG